jgi:WD40-like Beta Propeller Repeat
MIPVVLLTAVLAQASATYDAVTDRGPRAEPALVRLGTAGFSFNDPVFGTRVWRVTDRLTRPDAPDRSFRTPSATHQTAWSADGSYFYVVSNGGTIVPFAFDAGSGRFTRLDTLRFYIEPEFSYVHDALIYGSVTGPGASLRTIDQYDFSTRAYTRLLDLDTLVSGLTGTFVGGIASSAGPPEHIVAFFGGSSQDRHRYVVVFNHDDPQKRLLLDTVASTVNGKRLTAALDFHLHHAAIDRSGRYVALYPTAVDLAAPRKAAQIYIWNLLVGTITPLPLVETRSGGHDAFGYGVAVNKDCCAGNTPWDAAQWQLRQLNAPAGSRDLIRPLISPKEINLADHPTWNNARADRLVPFVSATYRYGANAVEWRPWDNEIVGVQTDVGDGSAEVWRFAHHRSDVNSDDDASTISFWYTPRPNISRDGRWVLFTSNWEKTLGTDPQGATGEKARQDVFLLHLTARD